MDTKMSRETTKKKETLLGKKKNLHWGWLVAGLSIGVAIAYSLVIQTGDGRSNSLAGAQVVDGVEYNQQTNEMKPVSSVVRNGVIELPLQAIKDNKLVSFSYRAGATEVPLLAYITPSGKLVTAVSMCEPCRSTKFHIEGDILVCNSCGTRWELETLRGISGGCLGYPPDALGNKVQGENVLIKVQDVLNWKPRA